MGRKTCRHDDWVWAARANMSVWENLIDKGISKNMASSLIKEKMVRIDGKKRDSRDILSGGEELRVFMPKEIIDYEPIKMDLVIAYEDDDVLVIDKPAGITVNSKNQISLANGIAYYFQKNNIKRKIRFLNRLDRDTSGCIMIAKSALAQAYYQKQLESRQLEKWYETVVDGELKGESTIEVQMGIASDGIRHEVCNNGKLTQTRYKVKELLNERIAEKIKSIGGPTIETRPTKTLVEVELLTGKTHQIRVAMAYIGHPLTNDLLYGGNNEGEYFYLRAKKIIFYHMRSFEKTTVLV